MVGFICTSVTISFNCNQYSAIADLHNFKFTVAHLLGFSVSTSRLLVTDLNTETITSNHYEVFLSFLLQSPWNADPILDSVLHGTHLYSTNPLSTTELTHQPSTSLHFTQLNWTLIPLYSHSLHAAGLPVPLHPTAHSSHVIAAARTTYKTAPLLLRGAYHTENFFPLLLRRHVYRPVA
jgi:hypothetical protein